MHNFSIIRSLFLIVVAVIVSYFFISPQASQIKQNQDNQLLFQNEIDRVSSVNQTLAQYQATIASVPVVDRQKLTRFLPTSIDEILVMKDLEMLLSVNNITPLKLEFEALENISRPQIVTDENLTKSTINSQLISISFESTYADLKNFLIFSEQHSYLLEFRELIISPTEQGDRLIVDSSIAVFIHQSKSNYTN